MDINQKLQVGPKAMQKFFQASQPPKIKIFNRGIRMARMRIKMIMMDPHRKLNSSPKSEGHVLAAIARSSEPLT